jgi:MFS family permease
MPEILRPHILSKGNGILESTTFLASILGTVSGGLLFYVFSQVLPRQEIWIGIILLVLSLIGALASMLIVWLPAASPDRPFPRNQFKPIIDNLKVMFRSRPLALAVLGIAFFIFMVAYMRASMYMHGETRNPRWDEQKTSLVVATVALGVALGSPLAGYLSGGKIELGLVPLGCVGMIVALVVAALAIEHTAVLVGALIVIGFFSGFYMVPLYTLLQHRAPKKSKGELVATSNFINVTGAIAASILFKVLVQLGRLSNVTPEVPITEVAIGMIKEIEFVKHKHGKIQHVVVTTQDGDIEFEAKSAAGAKKKREEQENQIELLKLIMPDEDIVEGYVDFDDNFFDVLAGTLKVGDEVKVSRHEMRGVRHYLIRKADQPARKIYDNELLPRYLFFGAGLMTLGILVLLCRKLPDFFVRTLFWLRSIGKYRIRAVGMQNLPTEGPVILATNCKDLIECLQLVSATDRSTKVVLIEDGEAPHDGVVLRLLAERESLIVVHPAEGDASWQRAKRQALDTLRGGHLLAISLDHDEQSSAVAALVHQLHMETDAPLLPVFCGSLDDHQPGVTPRIRIVFGEIHKLPPPAVDANLGPSAELFALAECKQEIVKLGDWIRANDDSAGTELH